MAILHLQGPTRRRIASLIWTIATLVPPLQHFRARLTWRKGGYAYWLARITFLGHVQRQKSHLMLT